MAHRRLYREKDVPSRTLTISELVENSDGEKVPNTDRQITVTCETLFPGIDKALAKVESVETIYAVLLHGMNAAIGDTAADPAVDAIEVMTKRVESIREGNFTSRSSGEGGPKTTQLAKAVARMSGKSVEEAVSWIANKSDTEIKALRQHPDVKRAMAEIRLEEANKAAETVEGPDLSGLA